MQSSYRLTSRQAGGPALQTCKVLIWQHWSLAAPLLQLRLVCCLPRAAEGMLSPCRQAQCTSIGRHPCPDGSGRAALPGPDLACGQACDCGETDRGGGCQVA